MADVLADPAAKRCRTEVDDAAERKCPVVGILTGISYISGVDYYQGINKQATQLLPPGKNMRNFPEVAMVSVNCAKYVDMLTHEDLTQAEDYLCGAVAKLNRIGVDFFTKHWRLHRTPRTSSSTESVASSPICLCCT
eukprot:GEMP01061753.1.p2 GENE.GEMP01061753.1~~GEMP01061753.1.p2  ORF type:complete len:153 (+),score=32.64 GEMP01061753.1:51-461(+)